NLIGAVSLASAVELFERSGKEAIAEHIIRLTDRLCDGLRELGAEIRTARGQGVSSGIVTFRIPGRDSIEIGRALEDERILTTYRSNGVRISPHGYNTVEEIDLCLRTLQRIGRAGVLV
ncbi:MAG: aminotransferase class V-fold PLP-dependent enzyme, partial [Candidatus Eremiobacteraeota bacterium]|nr:aminotransferase class V-fold PLP-dependent enzyme [Candidatus Eremiobacteraeota bacterium]